MSTAKSYFDIPQEPVEVWWKKMVVYEPFNQNKDGIIHMMMGEYRFLSNFHVLPILYNGKLYQTSEHAYQAAKCEKSEEGDIWKEIIRKSETPAKAKSNGMKCPLRKDWDLHKSHIMMNILCVKFSVPEMKENLLATGEKYLVEGNFWHDNHFGVCVKKDCEKCSGKRGENILGKILMQLRWEIKNG